MRRPSSAGNMGTAGDNGVGDTGRDIGEGEVGGDPKFLDHLDSWGASAGARSAAAAAGRGSRRDS